MESPASETRPSVDPGSARLTNLRYADDLLLFANSCEEAVVLFELLSAELARAGLSITEEDVVNKDAPLCVDAGDCMLEILRVGTTHKYLGRVFSGDLRNKGQGNLSHMISCGWMRFRS